MLQTIRIPPAIATQWTTLIFLFPQYTFDKSVHFPSAFVQISTTMLLNRSSSGVMVTPANLNPVIRVITWLLLAITTLMLCFRFLTKLFLAVRKVGIEEALVLTAYVSDLVLSYDGFHTDQIISFLL
jgi:hypothetical protein